MPESESSVESKAVIRRRKQSVGAEPASVASSPLEVGSTPRFGIPTSHGQFAPAMEDDVIPLETRSSLMQPMTTGATVIRFHHAMKDKGISALSVEGFKIASLTDIKGAGVLRAPENNPDVIYFERFGIAILNESDAQKTLSVLNANPTIASHRPERVYRALGMPTRRGLAPLTGGTSSVSRDYLLGYRAGMSALIDHLLTGNVKEIPLGTESAQDESSTTWGLQVTGTATSRFSGAGIRVAILDTGFDLSHPDFAGRSIISKSFVAGEVVQDDNGHGTHTAGTVCGPLKPASQPRYGIAYNAEMFIGKVLGNSGFGTDRSIIAGMDWALDQECVIISMSLGAEVKVGEVYNDDYDHIGQVCLQSGCLVVAAAGNNSQRPGVINPVNSPANCPSIMSVAALDSNIQVAEFSAGSVNSGQAVDLAAPGVSVLSSWPRGYRRLDGTSMATPHLAGIAALWAEAVKRNRGSALWNTLSQHCKALPLLSTDVGKGLVQAP
jgi:subtilisin family serine protease